MRVLRLEGIGQHDAFGGQLPLQNLKRPMPVDTRFKDHVTTRSSSHQRAKIFRMVRSAQLGIDKDLTAWKSFSVVYPAKSAVPPSSFRNASLLRA